jgi:cytochrome c553
MRLRRDAAAVLMAAAASFATSVFAQDAAAGGRKAAACQACHGLDGLSRLPDAPHLAGQPAPYLERALRAYRDGERRNEVMSIAAKPLSDQDIRDLAAYYASIQISIKAAP